MKTILTIIGSILIMPISLIGVGYFIYATIMIVKDLADAIKQDLFAGLLLTFAIVGIIGFCLLIIAICL